MNLPNVYKLVFIEIPSVIYPQYENFKVLKVIRGFITNEQNEVIDYKDQKANVTFCGVLHKLYPNEIYLLSSFDETLKKW